MEVIQAGSAGFCFGVARAVKMARELADTASDRKSTRLNSSHL